MRVLTLIFALIALVGCGTIEINPELNEKSNVVESAIFWDSELDARWVPIKLERLLSNRAEFQKEGDFYRTKFDLLVFGHKALFVGMHGIEHLIGPNVTVEGRSSDVAKYISEKYQITFDNHKTLYKHDYKEDIAIVVGPHPDNEMWSMIIGVYSGK